MQKAILLSFLLLVVSSLWSQPDNNDCENAQVIVPTTPFCTPTNGTMNSASIDMLAPPCALNASQDVWYQFVALTETNMIQLSAVSGLNHGFQVFADSCSGASLYCVNNAGAHSQETGLFNDFEVGKTYFVRVFNAGAPTNTMVQICIRQYATPTNNDCSNALIIPTNGTCVNTTSSFSGTSTSNDPPSCGVQSLQDIWFKFESTAQMNRITLANASGLNHGFQVFSGSCNGPEFTCHNNTGTGSAESLLLPNYEVGETYFIRVFNIQPTLSTQNFNICVEAFPTPDNDICSNAQLLTPGSTCVNTLAPFGGTGMDGSVPSCVNNAVQDLWFKFVANTETNRIIANSLSSTSHLGIRIIQDSCNGAETHCVPPLWSSQPVNVVYNDFVPGATYYIQVYHGTSFLITSNITICVQEFPIPANDVCSNAQIIVPTLTCNNVSGTFGGSYASGAVPPCGVNSSQDVWYQFVASSSSINVLLGSVSGVDHGFEIYENTCADNLLACVNNNGVNASESLMNTNYVIGQTYVIRVFNSLASTLTANFNICIQAFPEPSNNNCINAIEITPQVSCINVPTSFSGSTLDVGNVSCGPNASQDVWYKFVALSQSTSITLSGLGGLNQGFQVFESSCNSLPFFCKNQHGNGAGETQLLHSLTIGETYYVQVFNANTNFNSSNFNICIVDFPPPSNDVCSDAQVLTPGLTCSNIQSTFSGAYLSDSSDSSCSSSVIQDVWFQFEATSEVMQVQTSIYLNSNIGFEIYENSCSGSLFSCVVNSGASQFLNATVNNFEIGTTYFIRFFNTSFQYSTINFLICLQTFPAPPNSSCSNAQHIVPTNSCTNYSGTFSGAGSSYSSPSCAPNSMQDVWYSFTANAYMYRIQLASFAGLNHGFELYEGSCAGNVLECVNNTSSSQLESFIANNFNIGTTYYVRVFNAASNMTTSNFNICIQEFPEPSNNVCSEAITIIPSYNCNYSLFSFSGTTSSGPNSLCASNENQDLWFKFDATQTTMGFIMPGFPELDHVLEIFDTPCGQNALWCMNNGSVGQSETGSYTGFVIGQTYYIRVINSSVQLNTSNLTLCVLGPSPTLCEAEITISPTGSSTICQGDPVVIEAEVSNVGQSPIFHWYVNNIFVPGNASTFSSTSLNDGDQVHCVLSNLDVCAQQVPVNSNMIVFNVIPITVPLFSEVPDYCVGDNIPNLPTTSLNAIVGSWTPMLNNNVTTTYTFIPDEIHNNQLQCSNEAGLTIQVSSFTEPLFNQVGPYCMGSDIPNLLEISVNGISGTWHPSINNAESTNYSFEPNSSFCVSNTEMIIEIIENPSVELVYQDGSLTATDGAASYVWFYNGIQIPGANSNILGLQQNGIYTVEVSNFFGCKSTQDFNYESASLEDLTFNSGLFVYPNPSFNGVFNLVLSDLILNESIALQVSNVQGAVVYSTILENLSEDYLVQLHLSELPSGFYWARLDFKNDLRQTVKLIIQH